MSLELFYFKLLALSRFYLTWELTDIIRSHVVCFNTSVQLFKIKLTHIGSIFWMSKSFVFYDFIIHSNTAFLILKITFICVLNLLRFCFVLFRVFVIHLFVKHLPHFDILNCVCGVVLLAMFESTCFRFGDCFLCSFLKWVERDVCNHYFNLIYYDYSNNFNHKLIFTKFIWIKHLPIEY